MKQGVKTANQNSKTDRQMKHYNTAKYHVPERTRPVAKNMQHFSNTPHAASSANSICHCQNP